MHEQAGFDTAPIRGEYLRKTGLQGIGQRVWAVGSQVGTTDWPEIDGKAVDRVDDQNPPAVGLPPALVFDEIGVLTYSFPWV